MRKLLVGALAIAFAGTGCRGLAGPDDLVATVSVAPATFRSGTGTTVTVTVSNHGYRPRTVSPYECPAPFVVLGMDGRVVGPGHRICAAIALPPITLAPGESRVYTQGWNGDGRGTGATNILLPPGVYRVRAAVPAEDRILGSRPVTVTITQ